MKLPKSLDIYLSVLSSQTVGKYCVVVSGVSELLKSVLLAGIHKCSDAAINCISLCHRETWLITLCRYPHKHSCITSGTWVRSFQHSSGCSSWHHIVQCSNEKGNCSDVLLGKSVLTLQYLYIFYFCLQHWSWWKIRKEIFHCLSFFFFKVKNTLHNPHAKTVVTEPWVTRILWLCYKNFRTWK